MMSNHNGTQDAQAANTFTGAGTIVQTITLPGGAVGTPKTIKGTGSVSGYVTITYGNGAQVLVPVNPNAPFAERPIPPTAFPSKVGSVSVTLGADGAGVIRAIVSFAP